MSVENNLTDDILDDIVYTATTHYESSIVEQADKETGQCSQTERDRISWGDLDITIGEETYHETYC